MGAYKTETTQASSKHLNQAFIRAIDSGQVKEAQDESNAFIRDIVREEAAVRNILVPVGLQDDEIDRDENTDEPKKIVEKEPQSVATFVEFQGTPSAFYFRGPRYAIYFGKITSPEATKSKSQLMTYQNDIRKILADNFVKDMADEEDRKWLTMCNTLVAKNPAAQITPAAAFTSSAFKRAFQSLLNRRRPIGKMLMTKSLFMEAIDLPATAIGSDEAGKYHERGIEKKESLWGVDVVSTMKADIYDPRECWVFSPENFLGNFFMLQDATMFIKQERDMIFFSTYEILGIGIGNRLSMQKLVFSQMP